MSPDPLAGVRTKIERTEKHIVDLDTAVRSFLDTRPYKVGTKHDPDTRKLIYYVTNVDAVPPEVSQIAGDAIGNMVSILDHLAYRLFLKGGTGGAGRHIYFPITGKTALAEHVTARQRKVEGIPPPVVAALDALEPYQGGKGHQLWVLNELNNLSKHRDLIMVGSMFRSVDLGADIIPRVEKMFGRSLPAMPFFVRPADKLCPLKVGDELFIGAADEEPNYKMQFRFDVAISEPQIAHSEPLVEAVHQFRGLVDAIVKQFTTFL